MFTFDSLEPGEVEGERQLRGRPGHQQQEQEAEADDEARSVEVRGRLRTLDTYIQQLEVGRVWPMSPRPVCGGLHCQHSTEAGTATGL